MPDGTLDDLHEHIQLAMGWTHSHLHQFRIGGRNYGDPLLLGENFTDFDCVDSTTTLMSQVTVPPEGGKLKFEYEYDFGDGWMHQVVFEGRPKTEPGTKFPRCVAGARACPPDDVGGVWGYADFVQAITDPKHEEHDSLLSWAGGSFDPEAFSPEAATQEMKKGLPDWRAFR